MNLHRPSYVHRQWATLILVLLATFAIGIGVLSGARFHDDKALVPVAAGALVFAGILAGLFHSLVVTVRGDASEAFLRVQFGWGLIRRTIPLASIESARPVRNSWWYGWGIRLTPHGWLWNVSGLDAVELELTSGKRFRIGTDEPGRLVRAIEAARARQSGA